MQIVGGRIRLVLHPTMTTQGLYEEVISSVYSVSLSNLRNQVFEKNSDTPSVIYSLIPGDFIWERPKEIFASQFIRSIAARIVFLEELKGKADFLSGIYTSNIASAFVGQIYEEIIHSKIVQGDFNIEILRLPPKGVAEKPITVPFPKDFQVIPIENTKQLIAKVKLVLADTNDTRSYYFKPLTTKFEQVDSVVMFHHNRKFYRFLLQMTISGKHPINETCVANLARDLWGSGEYFYIYVIPKSKVNDFKRQTVKKGTHFIPSTRVLRSSSGPKNKPVEQYVAGIGGEEADGQSWMKVEFIDKLLEKVESAFVDVSINTLKQANV
jgi:hypothetical protein